MQRKYWSTKKQYPCLLPLLLLPLLYLSTWLPGNRFHHWGKPKVYFVPRGGLCQDPQIDVAANMCNSGWDAHCAYCTHGALFLPTFLNPASPKIILLTSKKPERLPLQLQLHGDVSLQTLARSLKHNWTKTIRSQTSGGTIFGSICMNLNHQYLTSDLQVGSLEPTYTWIQKCTTWPL